MPVDCTFSLAFCCRVWRQKKIVFIPLALNPPAFEMSQEMPEERSGTCSSATEWGFLKFFIWVSRLDVWMGLSLNGSWSHRLWNCTIQWMCLSRAARQSNKLTLNLWMGEPVSYNDQWYSHPINLRLSYSSACVRHESRAERSPTKERSLGILSLLCFAFRRYAT